MRRGTWSSSLWVRVLEALLVPPPPVRFRDGKVEVWGIPFDTQPLPGIARRILRELERRRGLAVFTPDARAISLAILRPEVRELYRMADFVVCDGMGTSWAARAFGADLPRVAGVDLAWEFCRLAEREGLGIYLLGARPQVLERAASRLVAAFPRLKLLGRHHGYFEGQGPLAEIRGLRPDILLVALGFPRQEEWILRNRCCGAGVMMGVGSTFDIWAGRYPRAPLWVQRAGLEWLWRGFQDPRRIVRFWAIPFLLYQIALGWMRLRLSG